MTARISRRAIACALLATTALVATPAAAQVMGSGTTFKQVDANGVDVSSGAYYLEIPLGSVGNSSPVPVQFAPYLSGASGHNLQAYFRRSESGTQATITITLGDFSEDFTGAKTATTFTSSKGTGSTLTKDSAEQYTLRTRDGSTAVFTWPVGLTYGGGTAAWCAAGNEATCDLLVQSFQTPAGIGLGFVWHAGENCVDRTLQNGEIVQDCADFYRIESAGSGGWTVVLNYANNTDPTTYSLPVSDWYKVTGATFKKGATTIGSASMATPSSTITQLTDIAGRTWQVTKNAAGKVSGVRRPGSAADDITLAYDASNRVSQITKDGITTTYGWLDSGSTRTLTITNALSQQTLVTTDLSKGRPTAVTDGLSRTTGFTYDANSRLTRTTLPEGNYVNLTYDTRDNVTERRVVAKTGSGIADIVQTASYDAACTNPVKCNKPNSTTDARGNTTDYTYDTTTGQLLTATRPAAAVGGIRPLTRYTYGQPTVGGPWMLTGVSQCQTLASCTGAADESKVTIGYDANYEPSTVTRANGTGTLSATSTMTYDISGNLSTVDGPLSGTADTSKYRYDIANQLVGVTSPDPDGAGTMKMRAVKLTYRSDGQVSKQELGTVNSQSDADWALFAPLQTIDVTFDANDRPAQQKLSSAGTDYALTQTSYDALGRTDCNAVRMNVAVYGALPASACTLSTQGSFGPDPISQLLHDAAGEVTQVKVGVGTVDAATERTLTYSNNGLVSSLKDGENNLTSYVYDGVDRLSKTRFPSPTKGAGTSSTTDYELLGYDPNSNVTSRRLRDATSIAFTYDNLNRVTLKDLPRSEPDVTYAYDLLDRVTSASQTGNALTFSWDALSRKTSEAGANGTVSSAYDVAGRRTQLTYPGTGLFVNYDYLVTGELSAIRENGATTGSGVLATYAYDDLGQRLSVVWSNTGGYGQTFAYDPISRLSSVGNNPVGATSDIVINNFIYNPAHQATQEIRSNDAYSWTGHYNHVFSGTANGLNQLTAYDSKTITSDSKGNLTANGSDTYGYSSENLLTSATVNGASSTLGYDPMLRLYQLVGTATTRFAYDGLNALAEYDGSGALQRRFVFDDSGNPVIWYEGSDLSQRRFVSKDERGSVIGVADSAANALAINTYDEFGMPSATNIGRFGYTGQAWLSEVGLNYYKARMYSPSLGRFMQTDPIGFDGDGPNLYAYVLNDPVNNVDPTGLILAVDDIIIEGIKKSDGGCGPQCTSGTSLEIVGGGSLVGGGGGCIGDCRPILIVGHRSQKPTGKQPFYFNGRGWPLDPLYRNCLGRALSKNKAAIGLDLAGAGLLLVAPEASAGAAIAGAALGTAGMINAARDHSALGFAASGVGKEAAIAEGLLKAGTAGARMASRFGVLSLATSVYLDYKQIKQDYETCR